MSPQLSALFASRQPSDIRLAQMEFAQRRDQVIAVNTAIGNVSLPMHPAMMARLHHLGEASSPFAGGVVRYSPTVGEAEAISAFLKVIASCGAPTKGLHCQVTDGASAAMELAILGVGGQPGQSDRPLMLIDPAYTNYQALANRLGRATVSVTRTLTAAGQFTLPDLAEMEAVIKKTKPGALVVIPADNPTGHFYDQATLNQLAKLCVKYDLWLISDEAYRQLAYPDQAMSSVWLITENEVPGITGRRISLESVSKVWNACGLRVGALVTDNLDFHQKSVAEYTANLCANSVGQYVWGAIAKLSEAELSAWYEAQRQYYQPLIAETTAALKKLQPKLIVSRPDAALYTVVDVRQLVLAEFEMLDFVLFCARQGKVKIAGQDYTLLVSPMAGFYMLASGQPNPGRTQLRIAYVESPEKMKLVPRLLVELLGEFLTNLA